MNGTIFTSKNYILFGICLGLLVSGYILLGQGPIDNPLSKSVAPVILVAVYCALIPFAILAKDKEQPAVGKGREVPQKSGQPQKKQGV